MSVRYLPIKTSSVASRGSMLNRIVHQIDLKPVDTSLFAEHDDNLDHPGQVNFEDILDPTPEDATVNINTAMSEGTNYSPDRHFIATPAGKGPQDDITEPVDHWSLSPIHEPVRGKAHRMISPNRFMNWRKTPMINQSFILMELVFRMILL